MLNGYVPLVCIVPSAPTNCPNQLSSGDVGTDTSGVGGTSSGMFVGITLPRRSDINTLSDALLTIRQCCSQMQGLLARSKLTLERIVTEQIAALIEHTFSKVGG